MPYLCGQAVLLVQKYGHLDYQDFVCQYFKDHAKDLHDVDYDEKQDGGCRLWEKVETEIVMQIGKSQNHRLTENQSF